MLGLDEIMTAPVNGSGCNEQYGLLGSNKSTEDKVKLVPRDCQGLGGGAFRRMLWSAPAGTWRSWSTATAPSRTR
ncbi:MAG: hypothetical protein ACLU9S_09855 [Oscillospiraceae bacterium]